MLRWLRRLTRRLMRTFPFIPGRSYRVTVSFEDFKQPFQEGEILAYRGSQILIYDGLFEFSFTDESGKLRKFFVDFDLPDPEVEMLIESRFKLIPRDGKES